VVYGKLVASTLSKEKLSQKEARNVEYPNVAQLSANKFFLRIRSADAILSDTEPVPKSLKAFSGSFHTIKSSNGSTSLNIDTATKAFYHPVSMTEFLLDKNFSRDY
jgi:hypothetical protein